MLLLLAAFCAIVVFLPAEGSIGTPLHESVTILLGPTAFVLPLALGFVGLLLTVRRVRPNTTMPARRLVGVALVALGVVAAEHLLGGVSLLGAWLTTSFVEKFGEPVTACVIVAAIGVGTWLAFDVRLPQRRKPDAAAG